MMTSEIVDFDGAIAGRVSVIGGIRETEVFGHIKSTKINEIGFGIGKEDVSKNEGSRRNEEDGVRTFGGDYLVTLIVTAILSAVRYDGFHPHSRTAKRKPTVVGENVGSNGIQSFPQ